MKKKRILTIIIVLIIILQIVTIPTMSSNDISGKPFVVDMNAIYFASANDKSVTSGDWEYYMPDNTWAISLREFGGYLMIGDIDLSQYDALTITYMTDAETATFEESGNKTQFMLSSGGPSQNTDGSQGSNTVIGKVDVRRSARNWEKTTVEMKFDSDYSGKVYFTLNSINGHGTLVSRLEFSGSGTKEDSISSISLDKETYTAFEPIIVTITGITEQMVNSGACVSVYEKGAKHDNGAEEWALVAQGNSTAQMCAPNKNGEFEARLYSMSEYNTDETFIMSVPFTVSGAMIADDWAQGELAKASQYELIPDCLKGQDLTKPITRAEFAAVSVKLYENLSGKNAVAAVTNPFTDTNDSEVLKAYNESLMVGISADKFDPKTLLNREQAATALTRVLKRTYIPGWTFATDGQYTLNFTMPAEFADDAKISDWAKPSVYFMVANKILNGKGNDIFAPRDVTPDEAAIGAANATCQEALAIAVRMVDNLKGKPLDYKQN